MNSDLISSYIDTLKNTFEFSVDKSPRTEFEEEDMAEIIDNELYVDRPDIEKALSKSLKPNEPLTCLIGQRGSGKSTIAYHVLKGIKSREDMNIETIKIDCYLESKKTLFQKGEKDVPFNEALRKTILERIRSVLFPIKYSEKGILDDSEELNLYANMLYYGMQSEAIDSEFAILRNHSSRLWHLFTQACRKSKDQTFENWKIWFTQYYSSNEIQNIIWDAKSMEDISHIVITGKKINKFDNMIIFLDNIDEFTHIQQAQAVNFMSNLNRRMRNICAFCVAVREENVRRPEYEPNFGANWRNLVVVDIDGKKDNPEAYPSVTVSKLQMDTLKKIIDKRLVYAWSCNEHTRKLEIECDEFSAIKYVSDRIFTIETLIETRNTVPMMLNDSIRRGLKFQYHWIDYYFNTISKIEKIVHHEEVRDSKWLTYFFRIIRRNGADFYMRIYDMCQTYHNWLTHNKDILRACNLEHLVLTTTLNLCIEERAYSESDFTYTKVERVIDRLKTLHYTDDGIKRTFVNLHWFAQSRGNQIEFQSHKAITSVDDIESNLAVCVTSQGEILLKEITNKVGYMLECIENWVKNHPRRTTFIRTGNDVNDIRHFLKRIGSMHLIVLSNFSKCSFPEGKFSDNYKKMYGILVDDGESEERYFQFELMVKSCNRFFRSYQSEFKIIGNKWEEYIEIIDSEKYIDKQSEFIQLIKKDNIFGGF